MTHDAGDVPLLVVPGLGGSGPDHWQSDWERAHPNARRVVQLDWDRPHLASWLEQLRLAVERTPGAVLVGHSLGCILIAHLARRHPETQVAGALLVAPADVDFPENLPDGVLDFAPTPLGTLPYPCVVVASTNDPFISIARAHELASAWSATFVNVQACGHINVAAGFGRWREGERILEELLQRIGRDGHDLEQHRHLRLARG